VTIQSNHIVSLRQAPSRRTVIVTAGIGLFGLMSGAAGAADKRHTGSKHPHRANPNDGNEAAVPGQTVGIASFYGVGEGTRTASGERFNPHAMTAAHRTLPLGSSVKVTNLANSKTVVVRINDRGPYARGRVIDLSHSAAEALDFVSRGLAKVRIETV
jgi:rare lipoprotein A